MSGSQQLLLVGKASSYQISRSVRLRSSAGAYLNRTFGTPTNNTIFTWSAWLKLGTLGSTYKRLFTVSSPNDSAIRFDSADTLSVYFNSTTSASLTTTQVFRDPNAWYHIVVAVDTPQATSSNRIKIYVNGVQVTAFGTASYPTISYVPSLNSANGHAIGRIQNSASEYFDGYLTEINFIDGQALTPTSFGAFDAVTGVWNPKAYSGTYGTNGFYLNFSDNSAATATTIGKDSSGNGNNWTPNNISVTNVAAPNTNDSMVDTPTNYGVDTGVGQEVRGNYAVLSAPASSGWTFSNANLTGYGGYYNCYFSMPITGKMYFEAYCTSLAGGGQMGFVKNATIALASVGYNQSGYYGVNYAVTNSYWVNGTNDATNHGTITNQTMKFAVDGATGKVWVGSGSTWYGSGDPANGTNPAFTLSLSTGDLIYPMLTSQSSTYTFTINTGQQTFGNAAPSGFKAMCTQNMTTPTITNGANYMAASLYTGTSASLTVSNAVNTISFQPDLVWVKSRSAATDHKLTDSVRGTTKALISDTTGAETTDTTGLTAFGTTGFTLGADATYNNSGATYVGWQWKGGGTAASNISGTITSSVSANTTAGFSVVAYTGNGVTSATVGHGLNVTPSFIITKNRDLGTAAWDWYSNHISLGAGQMEIDLTLNSINPATTFSNGGLAPATSWTNQVFSFVAGTAGNANNVNNNTSKFIAYCFAPISGYSAFGSYTGNNTTDGPFIYLGFRPRFLMIKSTSNSTDWVMIDTARNTYNLASTAVVSNSANNETTIGTVNQIDILSNGFKPRNNTGYVNAAQTYIYAAFAENPFTLARAR